jgi:hypothetical protein
MSEEREPIARSEIPAGAAVGVVCPDCGKVLLVVKNVGSDLNFFFNCIPDGITSIHPLTVKNSAGVTVAEWPEAVEYGRPIVFDEELFERQMRPRENGGT